MVNMEMTEITAASRQESPIRPVEQEHQDHHGEKQDNSSHDIRKIMGQQGLRVGRGRVKTAPDQPRGVGVKIAEGRLHHMGDALLSDVGCCAEGRQMGAHQACKIQGDPCKSKGKSHPAVPGDAPGKGPVRGGGDQIPGRKPDTDVRRHGEQHGYCRKKTGRERSGLCGFLRNPAGQPHRFYAALDCSWFSLLKDKNYWLE